MPLTQRLTFIAPLRKAGRLQVPAIIREQFKLDTTQTLKITITRPGTLGAEKTFFGKMRKDGTITAPLLTLAMLKEDKPNLEDYPIEVILEPP